MRAAVRWHARFVKEASPSLLRAQIALAALAELPGRKRTGKKPLMEIAG